MKQKRLILLALALILAMCGSNSSTTEVVESVEEVEIKQRLTRRNTLLNLRSYRILEQQIMKKVMQKYHMELIQ